MQRQLVAGRFLGKVILISLGELEKRKIGWLAWQLTPGQAVKVLKKQLG
ncbi:MAG: hypothetical protein AB1898_20945 [Acidobacteriota bacterium]